MDNNPRTNLEAEMQRRGIPLRHVVAALKWKWGVDVSVASVSRWAAGQTKPRWDTAIKLAELFETTPDLLFGPSEQVA